MIDTKAVQESPSQTPGLLLYTSNRLESLAGRLADVLSRPLSSPFTTEIVVVRNKGMERWLRLELARRHGISANQRFPFPESFGHELFRTLQPDLPVNAPLDRETLTWRIMKAMPGLVARPEFQSIAEYLDFDARKPASAETIDLRRALQLSARIANLFDQYLIFRPEMMLDWNRSASPDWQPTLWRAVSGDLQESNAAALWRHFRAALNEGLPDASGWPERLSIFGVSALPPFYLDLFTTLGRHLPVHLFLLQPSREYWGDITSAREDERILRRQNVSGHGPFEAHLEQGNRLLASLGYLGRDFLKLVLDAADWETEERFTDPGNDSLLHSIQSDILYLRDRGRDADCPIATVPAGDDTVQVHNCHSALREMEVLQDHLLDWFRRDSSLAPRDIVVMTPDIETYAPYVDAVFGAPEDPAHFIPFSVADRGARRQSHIVDTFLQLLDLPESRLGAGVILALLEPDPVRHRFGLEESHLTMIRGWLERTNIRWGRDAAHRADLGLPALPGNTWRAGLDRLVLGHGMKQDGDALFDGILPCEDIEGDHARVLGRFVEFVESVFDSIEELTLKRSLAGWADLLMTLLDRFFAGTEDNEFELQAIRDAASTLRLRQQWSGFDEAIPLPVLMERLRPMLEEDRFGSGFLTGGVTFCGLKPMRSIPFRVVCLVGMNDPDFPRSTRHLSFDMMARHPKLGDRSTREDDRYLFLETLLSARDRLYVSYVGQSIRDNKQAPPSVVISELLDYIEQGFQSGGASPRGNVVVQHRLQAFHPDYYSAAGRLFSYSRQNCQASLQARAIRRSSTPFIESTLPAPEDAEKRVSIEDLVHFLSNPSKYFLNRRMGVFLPEVSARLDENEPFQVGGLEGYRIKLELLERAQSGRNPEMESARATHEAAGDIPLGAMGIAAFRVVENASQRFLERLNSAGVVHVTDPSEIHLNLEDFSLAGRIDARTESGPAVWRPSKLKARDLLRAWVIHLVACCESPGAVTTVIAEDETTHFRPLEHPAQHLLGLLRLRWRGLCRPLPFFPETSLTFVEAEQSSRRGGKSPLEKAREKWFGSGHGRAEPDSEERHFELCFRGTDPLDESFQSIAREVLGPLLTSRCQEDA